MFFNISCMETDVKLKFGDHTEELPVGTLPVPKQ